MVVVATAVAVTRVVAGTTVVSAVNSVILVAVLRVARVARARNSLFGDFCCDLRFLGLLVVSVASVGGGVVIVLVVVVGEFLGDSTN